MSDHYEHARERLWEELEQASISRTESAGHLKMERDERERAAAARRRAGMHTDDIDAKRAERRAWREWQDDIDERQREEPFNDFGYGGE